MTEKDVDPVVVGWLKTVEKMLVIDKDSLLSWEDFKKKLSEKGYNFYEGDGYIKMMLEGRFSLQDSLMMKGGNGHSPLIKVIVKPRYPIQRTRRY